MIVPIPIPRWLPTVVLGGVALMMNSCSGNGKSGLVAAEKIAAPPEGKTFVIQAHRGAGNLAPENTLPSFQLTWDMGIIPEADVRATRDGIIVAFHDENFARLVKDAMPELQQKRVEDLTWEEAAKLDVGAYKGAQFVGQRIPRIADVFAAMKDRPERRIYLDIKKVPLATMADMARHSGVSKQVIVASPRYPELRAWKALSPESGTLLWMGGSEEQLARRMEQLRETDFADLTQLQIHIRIAEGKSWDSFLPSPAFLASVGKELKSRGILFQTFTFSRTEPELFHRLMNLGVESFASDEPTAALSAMRAYLPPSRAE